jgi:hypothetical protein
LDPAIDVVPVKIAASVSDVSNAATAPIVKQEPESMPAIPKEPSTRPGNVATWASCSSEDRETEDLRLCKLSSCNEITGDFHVRDEPSRNLMETGTHCVDE